MAAEMKSKRAPKPKARRKKDASEYWDGLSGWQSVDTGDTLLMGAEEGGFAGLEVLEDASIIDPEILGAAWPMPGAEGEEGGNEGKAKKAAKGASKAAGKAAKKGADTSTEQGAGEEAGDDMEALKARLNALERENAELKKRKASEQQQGAKGKKQKGLGGGESGDGAAAGLEEGGGGEGEGEPEGKALDPKAKRELYKQKILESKQRKKEERREKKAAARALKQQQQAAQGDAGGAATGGAAARRAEKAKRKGRVAEGQQVGGKEDAEEGGELADVSAWKVFSLQPDIEKALAMMGFREPSEIQKACLPAAIRDRQDIIGAAQTGSGKTLAFGLPIMQVLLQEREQHQAAGEEDPHAGKLRALVLTPTRELALQVCKHLQAVGKVCNIRVVAIVGGLAQVKQDRQLGLKPEVVVATPGRLWELIRESQPHVADMSHLSFLVLDEADRMVQQGHFQELHQILDLVPKPGAASQKDTYDADYEEAFKQDTQRADGEKKTRGGKAGRGRAGQARDAAQEGVVDVDGAEGVVSEPGPSGAEGEGRKGKGGRHHGGHQDQLMQTFVFSATLTLPVELRRRFKKGTGGGASGGASLQSLMDRIVFRGEPKIVDLTTKRRVATQLVESMVSCTDEERDDVLYYLLARHPGRTVVFVNAVSSVRRVAAILRTLGLNAHALHAQQQQRQRLKAVDRFTERPDAILVATDVAARGLDIPGVRCVVHYQLPASADTYVHRSGRTARAGQDGLSVALVTPKESPRWSALGRLLHQAAAPATFPVDRTVMPEVHRRVKLAIKLDEIMKTQRKHQADRTWAKANAEAIGIDLSDDDMSDVDDGEGDQKPPSASAKALQEQLANMLAAPLMPKMSTRFFTGGAAAMVAHGAGLQATTAGEGDHSAVPADTVNQAVHLANRLQQSKDDAKAQQEAKRKHKGQQAASNAAAAAAAAAQEAVTGGGAASTSSKGTGGAGEADAGGAAAGPGSKQAADKNGKAQTGGKGAGAGKGQVGKPGGVTKKGGKKAQAGKWLNQAELAKLALNKSQKRRQGGGKKSGLVVIPAAFGRDAQGVDALETLRRKLAAIKK